MKKSFAILVFAFAPLLSFCQDYVVSLKGDTLKGKVRIITMDPIDQVQVTIDKKKTTFTALKARTVFFENDTYNAVRNGQVLKFMKLVKPGYLSLYSYKLPNQTRYDGLFLVKKNGQAMDVPNLGFKKIMMAFLSECEAVSNALKDETLKRNDLNQIIDEFNGCVNPSKKGNDAAIKLLNTASVKEKLDAVNGFTTRANGLEIFSAKKDVLDILQDIKSKLEKQEPIPSYLYGVLKTHLANQPTMTEDLEKLTTLLTK